MYLSKMTEKEIEAATGLAFDEVEHLVGRFAKHSARAGQLRGKLVFTLDKVQIRKSFGNALLWEGACNSY